MEAPEKIYLERILCSNEVYDNWKSQKSISDDIEYVRKDVFVNKVCEFIEYSITGYIDVTHKGGNENVTLRHEFIKELRNYMKGE